MATLWICLILAHLSTDLPDTQTVTVAPKTHQLGGIGHGEVRTVTFSVTNSSDSEITVNKVKTSCSCMTVNFNSRTPLSAGETREGRSTIRFGRGWGKFSKYIEVQVEGHGPPLRVNVVADYHPGVSASPLELVLSGVHGKQISDATQSLVLRTQPGNPLAQVEVTSVTGKHLSARIVEKNENEVEIQVTVASEHPKGRISGKIQGTVNGLPFEMPVRGDVYGAIRWTPATLNLGQVIESGLTEATLLIESTRGEVISIRDIQVEILPGSQPVQIDAAVEPVEGGKARIRLAIGEPFPTKVGSIRARLHIRTNQPEEPMLRIQVLGVARPDRAIKKGKQ
ncbi:MAG TPA: DUF1573 domain-containing protein [Planctomycetes bacterium]|nr:DUF1573 domain-containing protein [Planctomycetota bacterium]HIN79950.1 DUF1573 domain-containing protein [Planctomycetota bacterium]